MSQQKPNSTSRRRFLGIMVVNVAVWNGLGPNPSFAESRQKRIGRGRTYIINNWVVPDTLLTKHQSDAY